MTGWTERPCILKQAPTSIFDSRSISEAALGDSLDRVIYLLPIYNLPICQFTIHDHHSDRVRYLKFA